MLKLPAGRGSPLPYFLTLVPPLALSLLDPEIFFKALDFAGTYGGMVLLNSPQLLHFGSILEISSHLSCNISEDVCPAKSKYLLLNFPIFHQTCCLCKFWIYSVLK